MGCGVVCSVWECIYEVGECGLSVVEWEGSEGSFFEFFIFG